MSVISPTVIPLHNKPWSIVNHKLLAHAFGRWSSQANRVFWTYSPVTYGFERGAKVSVYHCVDLYGQFPGIDSALIDREERRLAATGIQAIGSSQIVVEHLRSQGFREVLYWPNVADTQQIALTQRKGRQERSGALFAGNLSEKKVDFSVLRKILDSGVELHLAGPVAEGGGASQVRVDDLVSAGATYHGVLSLPELSTLMFKCRVGLIPYLQTPYTRGVSPLKTYEYLAAGLTVVSTPIPGVVEEHPHIYTPRHNDSFVQRVRAASRESTRHLEDERLAIADRHSWVQRGRDARELVKMRGGFC
ncbi:glycosyltransferase [Pseudarthrobacter scleromae]|uniref:glycosyltransferase n=1 Tax=Pseudarthrobacter scleromae TaxID=158897 RepID=UPI003636B978